MFKRIPKHARFRLGFHSGTNQKGRAPTPNSSTSLVHKDPSAWVRQISRTTDRIQKSALRSPEKKSPSYILHDPFLLGNDQPFLKGDGESRSTSLRFRALNLKPVRRQKKKARSFSLPLATASKLPRRQLAGPRDAGTRGRRDAGPGIAKTRQNTKIFRVIDSL